MRLKVFIGTTLSALLSTLTMPASAQGEPPSDGTGAPKDGAPSEPPAAPPSSEPAPVEAPPKEAPPAVDRTAAERKSTGNVQLQTNVGGGVSSSGEEMADTGPVKIGAELSPLIVTAGLGYAYAAVTHPELVSHNLSGAFLEVSAGTELDARFRLSISFTSFETKVRRTRGGKWEEGAFTNKVATGLHSLADPTEAISAQQGGVEVQKTFHAHSIGPRMDFLPLGSQGPYIGMTAAVAVIQDLATRVGADLAARIGGEWRPFHSLGVAIEAGAHGQIYNDSKAAIPYALARMTLLLEPASLRGDGDSGPIPTTLTPRTLPQPTPR